MFGIYTEAHACDASPPIKRACPGGGLVRMYPLMYLAGKPTWAECTCNLRDDAGGQVSRLVGEQMQKQFDFMEQASAASGIDYKFNDFIQAIHRCYRFGQKKIVNVHIIYSENEYEIMKVLKAKWAKH